MMGWPIRQRCPFGEVALVVGPPLPDEVRAGQGRCSSGSIATFSSSGLSVGPGLEALGLLTFELVGPRSAPVIRLNDSPATLAISGSSSDRSGKEPPPGRRKRRCDDGDPLLVQFLDQPFEPDLRIVRRQPAHGHLGGSLTAGSPDSATFWRWLTASLAIEQGVRPRGPESHGRVPVPKVGPGVMW